MRVLSNLFQNNRVWSSEMTRRDPDFFRRLAHQQAPDYLWIGCSDSRVPANEIVGLPPGELFVHSNVANVVLHADFKHIIVCGHYGCGGVLAALRGHHLGLVDNWLRQVEDVRWKHQAQLEALPTEQARHDRLCELNVLEQVVNVCQTTVVRDAWERGQPLAVHGWCYGLRDGLLHDLGICITAGSEVAAAAEAARATPGGRSVSAQP